MEQVKLQFRNVLCQTTYINKKKKKKKFYKTLNDFIQKFSKKRQNFFHSLKIQQQNKQILNSNISLFSKQKENSYKSFNFTILNKNRKLLKKYKCITYIIDIQFSKANTLLQVMNFSGTVLFFHSAGTFKFSGKSKKARYQVFQAFYKALRLKLKFLAGKPIGLNLKNVGSNKFWIINKLKKKFFLQCINIFENVPYNGCRKRKMRRKKFKKRKKEEMAEWFKAADCKSVDYFIGGSNPSFFIIKFRNITQR